MNLPVRERANKKQNLPPSMFFYVGCHQKVCGPDLGCIFWFQMIQLGWVSHLQHSKLRKISLRCAQWLGFQVLPNTIKSATKISHHKHQVLLIPEPVHGYNFFWRLNKSLRLSQQSYDIKPLSMKKHSIFKEEETQLGKAMESKLAQRQGGWEQHKWPPQVQVTHYKLSSKEEI